ncbi:Ankrd17 [Symbiodinium sp. CCMP2592]|nr:Ankrd17 [Symbiodinium sp. CCMP2592]
MVAFASEARHNQIIGELGAEHQEQLRAMCNSGLAEVTKLRNELGNANIALSIQRSEMGQGEARFQQTESARELAVLEANRQAEAARRAVEEANNNARRLREVETSARQNDAMRSHEVADMSARMDELMRQLQAQRQQTEVTLRQNRLRTPEGEPLRKVLALVAVVADPMVNGPSGGDDDHDRHDRKSKKDKKHKKKKKKKKKSRRRRRRDPSSSPSSSSSSSGDSSSSSSRIDKKSW